MKFAVAYTFALIFFFAVDLVWLGLVARGYYREGIGHLMTDNFNVVAAVVFYVIYAAGILYFSIMPGIEQGNWRAAALSGALFGFFAYATYDLTNLATLRGWPVGMSIVDVLWGTALTAATACIAYAVASRF